MKKQKISESKAVVCSSWNYKDDKVYCYEGNTQNKSKIAAFDMDHCLLMPKGKNKFPKDRNDWKYFHDSVPVLLKKLDEDGYHIVVFSNQKGLEKPENKHVLDKLIDFFAACNIPHYSAYFAVDHEYRKPGTAMFDLCVQHMVKPTPEHIEHLDLDHSFFVGDAAGREGDFSSSDYGFAINIFGKDQKAFVWNGKNLKQFMTPEYFFANEAEKLFGLEFDPWKFKSSKKGLPVTEVVNTIKSFDKVIVILVGPPGSSKSTLASLLGGTRINQDTLKTKDKCVKAAINAVHANEKCIVIDNTNPSKEVRSCYLLGGVKGYKKVAIVMEAASNIELAKHLNGMRWKMGISERVPDIAYNMWKSKFEYPTTSEGIDFILDVAFEPNFTTDAHKDAFYKVYV